MPGDNCFKVKTCRLTLGIIHRKIVCSNIIFMNLAY